MKVELSSIDATNFRRGVKLRKRRRRVHRRDVSSLTTKAIPETNKVNHRPVDLADVDEFFASATTWEPDAKLLEEYRDYMQKVVRESILHHARAVEAASEILII